MLVKIENNATGLEEWSILEFQGEMVGEGPGLELGKLIIDEVSHTHTCQPVLKNKQCLVYTMQ